jgi:hypothetical protein
MSETTTGLIGEMIAGAAILSMNGWAYAHAAQDKIDGVAISKTDNTVLRIQVKTASLILAKGKRTPAYHFQLGSGCSAKHLPRNTKDWADYDILVLCGKEHRSCLFFHVSQIQQYSKRMQGSAFTREAEEESWLKAVALAKEMRR